MTKGRQRADHACTGREGRRESREQVVMELTLQRHPDGSTEQRIRDAELSERHEAIVIERERQGV